MSAQEEAITIRDLLLRKLPFMRPSEQKVASFLLYEGASVADWSLSALATAAAASPAAVVRMCQSIGFDGFRTFRHQWLMEHAAVRRHELTEDHPLNLAIKVLQETVHLISPEDIARAGAAIRNAGKVMIYGQGGSGNLARITAASLTIVGRLAVSIGESERSAPDLPIDASTVLVVVSHRGQNPAIHKFTQRCKEKGAHIIVVTSGAGTPLTTMADILLLTGAPVENDLQQLELVPTRVVQMAVLQALVQASR